MAYNAICESNTPHLRFCPQGIERETDMSNYNEKLKAELELQTDALHRGMVMLPLLGVAAVISLLVILALASLASSERPYFTIPNEHTVNATVTDTERFPTSGNGRVHFTGLTDYGRAIYGEIEVRYYSFGIFLLDIPIGDTFTFYGRTNNRGRSGNRRYQYQSMITVLYDRWSLISRLRRDIPPVSLHWIDWQYAD